jgi:hypothetical protein
MVDRLGAKGAIFRAPPAFGIDNGAGKDRFLLEPLPDLGGQGDQVHGPIGIGMGQLQGLLPGNLPIFTYNFIRQINKGLIQHGIPYI